MSFLEVLVQNVFLKSLSLEEAIEGSVRKPVPEQEEILAVHEILSKWKTELLDFSNFAPKPCYHFLFSSLLSC
jgi:hypothetical protein